MNTTIERLKALPQRRSEVWQGGLFRMPSWIAGKDQEPYRPYICLCVAVNDRTVHSGSIVPQEELSPQVLLDNLCEFACETEWGGYRPGRVEVSDAKLAEFLASQLAGTDIEVRQVEHLAEVERALASLESHLSGGRGPMPGPLDGKGVTIDRLHRFALAAAAFYRAAPWQYLTDIDLLHIEGPAVPRCMRHAVILGAAGMTYGLGMYPSASDHYRCFQSRTDPPNDFTAHSELCQFTFDAIAALPVRDGDAWVEHDLPVADKLAYPLAMRYLPDGGMARLTSVELAFLEGLLWALSQTTEAEIDSGRWSKKVTTYDGPMTVSLAIPDLLQTPTVKEWLQRGLMPDDRAHGRAFADLERYFRAHPPADLEAMNATMARLFTGKSSHQLVTQPETPQEQAEEYCYQAFDTFGRRRVQLARQALALLPDCADAHVILAEQAGSIAAKLDHYALGVAAGERALGPEVMADEAGHFWGIPTTRPYMRARLGLAISLAETGRVAEAIDHFQEMLRLNPNDNQGVRYLLLPHLMQLGRDAEAAKLLQAYDDSAANWHYARALLAFRLGGKSVTARKLLRAALRVNPSVPACLLDEEEHMLPAHYSPGGPEEALICADELQPAFAASAGALEWLAAEYQQQQQELEVRRKEHRRKQRQQQKKPKRK